MNKMKQFLTLKYILMIVLSSSIFVSCNKASSTIPKDIDELCTYITVYEDDSIRVTSKNFPAKDEFTPRLTEVWKINKLRNDSMLCVKSNPTYFGRGTDSIPSIENI